ncbi:MAG: methyltransferase domain-containing protein [Burkholderiaceae bacterium]
MNHPQNSAAPDPIQTRFSDAAQHYAQHAPVQRQTAQALWTWTEQQLTRLGLTAPERMVDLGCGTGFLSEAMVERFPNARLTAVDWAPGMLMEARRHLTSQQIDWQLDDARSFVPSYIGTDAACQKVDLIASSLCFQWFDDLPGAVAHCLRYGRQLFFSVLLDGSFSAWRHAHLQAGSTPRLRSLPTLDELNGLGAACQAAACTVETQRFLHLYANGHAFARALKEIGAHTAAAARRPAALTRLRPVLQALSEPVEINYDVAFVHLQAAAG